jgi:integrase
VITVAEASQKYLTGKPGKQPKDYTFLQAWIQFMEEGISRSRQPFSASTQKAYKGLWRKWINPRLRTRKISAFTPLEMKKFIKELRTNKLADKTVTLVVTLVRSIIRSVRDDQGNRVFATQYDADFIDLPEVRKRDQKTPSITREQLEAAIASEDETALLLIFLASTGLRIGEALAVRPGNLQDEVSHYWAGAVYVRTQQRGGPLKTDASRREVEVSTEVHGYLAKHLDPKSEYLFSRSEAWYRERLKERGVPGFHSARRFYRTTLSDSDAPYIVQKFWMGHEVGDDVSERYDKLASSATKRREVRNRVDKGFSLPGEKKEAEKSRLELQTA